ncbi:MAG: ECF transporter S component, partial [Ruminococcus sp.]|nr:ECF transporter S component [Ruminococcus sp.]
IAFFGTHVIHFKAGKKCNSTVSRIISAVVSEMIMITGYSIFAGFMYGSVQSAFLSIPENMAQGIIGAVVSVVLYEAVLKRVPVLKHK